MIYLARHGESIANTQGIYQGQTYDTRLSVLGAKQATALAHRFSGAGLQIIASPLLRARLTALAVGLPMLEPRIVETNHGAWEGKHKNEIELTWPYTYAQWLGNPKDVIFPDGEAFVGTQTRVLEWWAEIVDDSRDLLVVSHDNILRIIIAHVLRMDLNDIWQFHLQPAAISVVEVVNHKPKIICLNDVTHLQGLETDLSTHAL